ncbi:MAG: M48 family metalloprotease, partial [Deltaproteobacteria bacterium]|nr:M48 family metalloprotease [Deltaproteobacteria bacterium]
MPKLGRIARFALTLVLASTWLLSAADPCLAILSKAEEREMGRKVLEEVHKEFRVLDDPYVTDYLVRMGARLVKAGQIRAFDANFYVVADARINAFAIHGGHVFVTSETLLMSSDESELAGVIAHELGHVEGRHLAYQMESATKLNIATLAAVLAGIFLMRTPQASAAVTSFALAGAQTKMLQYSRADEEDADRRGLHTLSEAGYDGWGLVRFMDTIRKEAPTPEGVPAYLFTHPLPENRSAYLSDALGGTRPLPRDPASVSRLWRVQGRVLAQDPRPWGLSMMEKRAADNPANASAQLAFAVVLRGAGRYGDAERTITAARALAPEDPEILHEAATIELLRGRRAEGLAILEGLRTKGIATEPALRELGWNYLEAEEGEKALGVYAEIAKRSEGRPPWDRLDYYRGLALGKAGREGEAHQTLGDYYRRTGDPQLAVKHYREALRLLPPGPARDPVEQALRELQA